MSRLQRALRQRRPFASAAEEAYLNLVRTADQLTRTVARVLKPHGLSEAQYNVLRILRGAGADGHACSEVGARLVAHDPDVTRLLDRLERRALLVRVRGAADRRVVTARITPLGLQLLAELDAPVREAVDAALGHVPASRLKTLSALLDAARGDDPPAAAPAPQPAGGPAAPRRRGRPATPRPRPTSR